MIFKAVTIFPGVCHCTLDMGHAFFKADRIFQGHCHHTLDNGDLDFEGGLCVVLRSGGSVRYILCIGGRVRTKQG